MRNETLLLLSSSIFDDDRYSSTSSTDDSFHETRRFSSSGECIETTQGPQKTTVKQTAFNIAKMCMGTGTLALPYAACQGGYLFNAVGLAVIMIWNLYSVDRLLKCLSLLPYLSFSSSSDIDDEVGKDISTPRLEKVTLYAFGPMGVKIMDGISLTLYCGVITAYIDAMIGFISMTAVSTGSKYCDGILLFLFLVPLSSTSDLKFLSQCSAMGIFVLISVQITLAISIVSKVGYVGLTTVSWNDLWPRDWDGMSHWFGIVSFSMGVVPFTYSIQESMETPSEMKRATEIAVLFIYISYVFISNGLAMLVSPLSVNVQGDMLELFPEKGWVPTFVRLSMTLVILVTAPLIVMPAGRVLVSKFGFNAFGGLMRIAILFCCLCLSILIHNSFVHIISFVGCFCVSLMSFVFPPLVHLRLYKRCIEDKTRQVQGTIVQDSMMLLVGSLACIVTSCQTLYTLLIHTGTP